MLAIIGSGQHDAVLSLSGKVNRYNQDSTDDLNHVDMEGKKSSKKTWLLLMIDGVCRRRLP
jgi:hypothetical protein